jgi:hypothetical protein
MVNKIYKTYKASKCVFDLFLCVINFLVLRSLNEQVDPVDGLLLPSSSAIGGERKRGTGASANLLLILLLWRARLAGRGGPD